MNEPLNPTHRRPTCPSCGATRGPGAVPYQDAEQGFAVYTCASCGEQFETWSDATTSTTSTSSTSFTAGRPDQDAAGQ